MDLLKSAVVGDNSVAEQIEHFVMQMKASLSVKDAKVSILRKSTFLEHLVKKFSVLYDKGDKQKLFTFFIFSDTNIK